MNKISNTIQMKIKILFCFLTFMMFLTCCKDPNIEPYFPPVPGKEDEDETDEEVLDPAANIYNNYEWVTKIRRSHPRLFFNIKTFEDVKARTLNEEKAEYDRIKSRIDLLLDKEIVFENPLIDDGTDSNDHKYGTNAAEAAFIYKVTGDVRYFDLSKRLLEKVIEYYEYRNSHQLNISWYVYSRLHALMAYDWIYNDLSEAEKISIGRSLFNALEFMLPSTSRSNFYRENRSGIDGGFYNNQAMEWYLGLVFHGTGVNDTKALEILKRGYDSHKSVLQYRENASGDDGGAASGTLPYCLADYPWAENNFFHSFMSATGGYNITTQYDYLPNFVSYLYWNLLPQNREFGFGDAHHTDNSIDFAIINMHLSQLVHFYGDRFPMHASVARYIMNELYPRKVNEPTSFPMARFFLTNKHEGVSAFNPSKSLPKARYFESMGQFFMRSGSGPDDTYATFTVSSNLLNHKHYDNNNFLIYKKGFVTLDTGTRPDGIHLSHYYSRTIAHNCVTIRMPGEVLPRYWGSRAPHEADDPVPNDGGQNNLTSTKAVAFDEQDEYVYIASDATGSYNSLKTNLVLRQFVYLPPDNFVVFDRLNATNASYPKKWLLHTAYPPQQVSPQEFYASHEQGRLVCKTIYPENSTMEFVGGPGKQFWSDWKNWALPYGGDNHPLYGQWRIEVSPATAQNDDIFLHLIQVGDRSADVRSLPTAQKAEESGMKGVQFSYANKTYKVLFTTTGKAGGKITITEGGSTIVDENFTSTIKQQTGLALR